MLAECCGSWAEKTVIFWDREGKYATAESVVDRIYENLVLVAFGRMQSPAANKWLSVWPVANNLALMQAFHGLFVFALRFACNVQSDEQDDLGDAAAISDDELLGSLSKTAWHRRERRRELKALAWAELGSSFFVLAVFSFVGGHVMRLHFLFFKKGQTSSYGDERGLIFELCGESSPVAAVLAALWSLLEESAAWAPLESMFGVWDTWPADRKYMAKEIVHMSIAEVTRRIAEPMCQPPFGYWTRICDPHNSYETRLQAAVDLFAVDVRCLDSASVKLRRRAKRAENLMCPFWQKFMFHTMNKVPLSSACVECLFAHFKQWQMPSSKPLAPAFLSTKHVTHEALMSLTRKRDRMAGSRNGAKKKPRIQFRRPAWVFKTGECARRNAFHDYVGAKIRARPFGQSQAEAFREASKSWREDEQLKIPRPQFSARAKRHNRLVAGQKQAAMIREGMGTDVVEVEWWGSMCRKYPLQNADMRRLVDARGGVKDVSAKWVAVAGTVVPNSPVFPSEVRYRRVLVPALLDVVDDDAKALLNSVCHSFKILLGAKGLEASRNKRHVRVTRCILVIEQSTRQCTLVLPGSVQKSPAFGAWFLRYVPVDTQLHLQTPSPPYIVVPDSSYGVTPVEILAKEVSSIGPGPFVYHFVETDEICPVGSSPGTVRVISHGEPVDFAKLAAEQKEQA